MYNLVSINCQTGQTLSAFPTPVVYLSVLNLSVFAEMHLEGYIHCVLQREAEWRKVLGQKVNYTDFSALACRGATFRAPRSPGGLPLRARCLI